MVLEMLVNMEKNERGGGLVRRDEFVSYKTVRKALIEAGILSALSASVIFLGWIRLVGF